MSEYLSEDAVRYMGAEWGLESSDQCDDVVMLWSSGYYEACAKLLVSAGAVEGINDESKEMLRIAKRLSNEDVCEAVDSCLESGDWKLFECKHCGSTHFLNSVYFDDYKTWPCHSCNKSGLKEIG